MLNNISTSHSSNEDFLSHYGNENLSENVLNWKNNNVTLQKNSFFFCFGAKYDTGILTGFWEIQIIFWFCASHTSRKDFTEK